MPTVHHDRTPTKTAADTQNMDTLGHSLGGALRSLGITPAKLGALLMGAAAFSAGCSPQGSSYFFGSFTQLPPPPPEARMQLGVSTEEDGTVFINYVVWNSESSKFERKDFHYTSKKWGGAANYGDFREAGGYAQEIVDGEVLYGNAIVDQQAGRIILPNGNYIEGKTGDILAADGTLVKAYAGGDLK